MTSFGARLKSVHTAIASIGAGTVRPKRLILWLDDPEAVLNPPAALQSLVSRGLEIQASQPLGPHTKYYPAVEAGIDEFVTADDDIIYPPQWLERLMTTANASQADAIGWRGRTMTRLGLSLSPSASWEFAKSTDKSTALFLTGVSGVYYRSALVEHLRAAGSDFLTLCPTADDIWLNYIRCQTGGLSALVAANSVHFPLVRGSQDVRLGAINVDGARNDTYLQGLYSPELVDSLALEEVCHS